MDCLEWGDVMPNKDIQDIPVMDSYDAQEPDPEPHYFNASNKGPPVTFGCKPKVSLKYNLQFTDVGETPFVSCTVNTKDPENNSQLRMSHVELNIDNTIEHFPRTGKVPYTDAPHMTLPTDKKGVNEPQVDDGTTYQGETE